MIVLAFGAFLLIQGVISAAIGPEPYPTIRLPGFGAAPDQQGLFRVTTVDINVDYTDGSIVRPSVAEFMGDIAYASSRPTLDRVYRGVGQDDLEVEVIAWTRERAVHIGNGSDPMSVSICWKSGYVDVRTYELQQMSPCEITRIQL